MTGCCRTRQVHHDRRPARLLARRAVDPRLGPWVDASNASRVDTGAVLRRVCIRLVRGLPARPACRSPAVQIRIRRRPSRATTAASLADGALLVLVACFGLAERGHETTPQLAQFAWIAMLVYGIVRGIDKPMQGALVGPRDGPRRAVRQSGAGRRAARRHGVLARHARDAQPAPAAGRRAARGSDLRVGRWPRSSRRPTMPHGSSTSGSTAA